MSEKAATVPLSHKSIEKKIAERQEYLQRIEVEEQQKLRDSKLSQSEFRRTNISREYYRTRESINDQIYDLEEQKKNLPGRRRYEFKKNISTRIKSFHFKNRFLLFGSGGLLLLGLVLSGITALIMNWNRLTGKQTQSVTKVTASVTAGNQTVTNLVLLSQWNRSLDTPMGKMMTDIEIPTVKQQNEATTQQTENNNMYMIGIAGVLLLLVVIGTIVFIGYKRRKLEQPEQIKSRISSVSSVDVGHSILSDTPEDDN
ncbi:unnamed protein product, partial [Didymodactylos carnosus]